jgi:hypothetical protein
MQSFRPCSGWAVALFAGIIFGTALTSLGQITVLQFTNEWKFLQATSAPSAWMTNDFDDAQWPAGGGAFAVPAEEPLPAGLGVNTVLSTNLGDGYIFTSYFRAWMTLASSPTNVSVTGAAAVDDGAVIYVNGREAQRIGMPTGTISYRTAAARSGEVASRPLDTFALASSNFVQGDNLIAVEVHQDFNTSSDIVFAMKLDVEQLSPVVITTQPADQTVPENSRANFHVEATGSRLRYQWFRNNVAIPGATNALYQTSPVTFALSGSSYHVVVSNPVNVVRSAPATLTVVADTFRPRVESIVLDTNMLRVIVQFDETISPQSATNRANYSLMILGTTNTIPITNAQYALDRVRVWANQALNPRTNYALCIANVFDLRTNALVPNPTCLPVLFETVSNAVSMGEVWRYNDIELGPLPTNWMALDYNDDPNTPPYHWAEARAAFANLHSPGFQPCSPVRTFLSLGPITYYFRTRFFVSREYPTNSAFRLRHMVDDGAVFYLNGREIYRRNMPPDPITYTTRPLASVGDAQCVTVSLEGVRPVVGTNVLAVEVHQVNEPIADVAFDTEATIDFLRGPELPALRAVSTNGQAVFTWEGAGWRLQSSEAISGPWSDVTTTSNSYVILPTVSEGRRFLRLVAP